MNPLPLTRPRLVDQLAIGISRITVRHGHWKPRYKKPQPELSGYAPDHGEKIYIFANVRSQQVVYSHSPVLNVYKALAQLPFAGKKTKPAKIRKDTWRQLAMVQFPQGKAAVGRSVFAKLREFRRRHELEWGDEMFFEDNEEGTGKRTLSRQERGKKIHEQRANAVADLAAVLAGAGKSSKMWLQQSVQVPAANEGAAEGSVGTAEAGRKLCEATVYWANTIDRQYAESWSENVSHGLLPDGADWLESKDLVQPPAEAAKEPVAEKA